MRQVMVVLRVYVLCICTTRCVLAFYSSLAHLNCVCLILFVLFFFLKGLKSPPESLSDLGAFESLRVPGKVLIYMCGVTFHFPKSRPTASGY